MEALIGVIFDIYIYTVYVHIDSRILCLYTYTYTVYIHIICVYLCVHILYIYMYMYHNHIIIYVQVPFHRAFFKGYRICEDETATKTNFESALKVHSPKRRHTVPTWRIIPASGWLVTTFTSHVGHLEREPPYLRGLLTKWDEPPSREATCDLNAPPLDLCQKSSSRNLR